MTEPGTFSNADELADLLRRRQVELGISNAGLERIVGWSNCDKYLGPGRSKALITFTATLLLDALGLSCSVHVDPAKVKRMQPAWQTEGKRMERTVHPSPRVGRELLKRVRPIVMTEGSRKANEARWSKIPKEQRRQMARALAKRRWHASADA